MHKVRQRQSAKRQIKAQYSSIRPGNVRCCESSLRYETASFKLPILGTAVNTTPRADASELYAIIT